MGDCRIRIVIAKSLFFSLPDYLSTHCENNDCSVRIASNKTSVSFVRMYPADNTIREVVDENLLLRKLYFGNSCEEAAVKAEATSEFTLWDCTFNPPQDITSWPCQDYPDLQGLKSKTLHAAGLFPSGTWMAIPKGMIPNNFSDYDSNVHVDVQYNSSLGDRNGDAALVKNMNTSKRVEFNDPTLRLGTNDGGKKSTPLPSQIMETVSNRFAAEEHEEEMKRMEMPESSITALRRENLQRRAQKEVERAAKLDRKIAMLEEQSNDNKPNKKKKISDQVLRMLVKSRATGDKNLKEKDRLYFQCLIIVDDNGNSSESTTDSSSSKEYRYFSPQHTFAKVANTFSKGQHKEYKDFFCEVLCRQSVERTEEVTKVLPVYGRFPTTMRIYEAIAKGYLSLSENITNYFDDVLIIRWYKDRDDATPLIHDGTILDTNDENDTIDKEGSDSNNHIMIATSTSSPTAVDTKFDKASNDADRTTTFEDTQLLNTIREMDDSNKTGIKKGSSAKKSAAAIKVRQMKMKSKAKGNKKLKIEERVFLEVVSISEIGSKPVCECYFLSRRDSIEKILQYVGASSAEDWEFLVPQEDSRFLPIASTSILMKDAEEQKLLKSFDRIILRPKPH